MYPWKNKNLPIVERVQFLINELTTEEKLLQLKDSAPGIPRLGIRPYHWWNEALHGVARAGIATGFPQAIGLAATWNPDLLHQVADIISTEARAKYNEAQKRGCYDAYYGLTFWSPNINIFRDPRWGRGQETYGEDPYLTSIMADAYIRGMQGTGEHLKTAACVKHLVAHSGPEKGRGGFNSVVSKKDLYETYLPAFQYCVQKSGVEAVMSAYNALNGVPCAGNEMLLKGILRDEMGFTGHVVSDAFAVGNLYMCHHCVDNLADAAAEGLRAGCDLNVGAEGKEILTAYQEGNIQMRDVDQALTRLFTTRFRLGEFDDGTEYDQIPMSVVASSEHKAVSLQAARESFVLLENPNALPLVKTPNLRVAVIGPNAHSNEVLLGNYHGTPSEYVTMYRGFADYLGSSNVSFAKGCDYFEETDPQVLQEAVDLAKESDVTILCLGWNGEIEGEEGDAFNPYAAGDRILLELPPAQCALFEHIRKASSKVITVVFAGGAVAIPKIASESDALLHAWYPGELGGQALAEIIFGDCTPSGKLPITFYRSTSELPAQTDYAMSNRTYRYFAGSPLYPFGYGLSYTTFDYHSLQVECVCGEWVANVSVQNTGNVAGKEIVQVYIKNLDSIHAVPNYRLIAFSKVDLLPGETKQLTFKIDPSAFTIVDTDGIRRQDGNQFKLFVGGNPSNTLSTSFRTTISS